MTVQAVAPVERCYTEFLSEAPRYLDEVSASLSTEFARSLRGGGYWHPNGFQVFNLRDIEGFGLVRLHVWPAGKRGCRRFHPVVHSHAFHLLSYVLHGVYREKRYDVATSPNQAEGWLGWSVLPARGDGLDRVEMEEVRYQVEGLGKEDAYVSGRHHEMPGGEYHSTVIAPREMCVTLALLSRPVPGCRDHLVGGRPGLKQVSARLRVRPSELEWISELDCLG